MDVLKVTFKDQTRRINLEQSLSYDKLCSVLPELFTSLPAAWVLKYVDDEGDQICVSSEREFQESIRVLKSLKTPSLRYSVAAVKQKKVEASPKEEKKPQSLGELVQDISKRFPFLEVILEQPLQSPVAPQCPYKNQNPNTHFATCDNCNQSIPFPGSRFKCNVCPDYDLCSKCRPLSGVHPSAHKFTEIKDPRTPVHPAFCDNCENMIVGNRHKCQVCPDFDLCQTCFDINPKVHKDHSFQVIEKPPSRWVRRPEAPVKIEIPKPEAVVEPKVVVPLPVKEEPKPEPKVEVKPEPVVVPLPKPVEVPLPKPVEKEESKPVVDAFTMKLNQLEDMGFTDRSKNVHLLMKHKGDLVAVVKDLLF